jgi:hypothetical protein
MIQAKAILQVSKFMFALAIYDLFRFGNNFARIHRLVLKWKVAQRSVPAEIVNRECQALRYARVWYPKRVRCLQRSAVLACLLRRYGIPAQMVMGSQKSPFRAHAWVEIEGRVINERGNVNVFTVWDRC